MPICGATRLQLRFPKVLAFLIISNISAGGWSLFERMVLLINSKVGSSTAAPGLAAAELPMR
jgi:hypothetical protein